MKRLVLCFYFLLAGAATAQNCLPDEFFATHNPNFEGRASEYYAENLRELQEPCLYDFVRKHENKEIYRFQWSGSLHYLKTILVRLEINPDGSGTAYIKARKGDGGRIPGKMPKDEIKQISKEKVEGLLKIVDAFWTMPYSDDVIGLDGTGWYLEAVSDGKFHAVYRWSPGSRQKLFHQIGEYFLYKIAEVKFDHSYLD